MNTLSTKKKSDFSYSNSITLVDDQKYLISGQMHIRRKSFEFIFLIEIIPAFKKRRIRDSKVFVCSTKGDTAGRWISPLRLVTGEP